MKISLKLELGLEQQSISFTSIRSIQSWVEHEKEFWSWLEESVRHDGLIRNYWNRINNSFTHISSSIEEYKSNKEHEYRDNALDTIQNNLHSLQSNVLLSTDDRAQFSSEVAQKDPVLAGFVVVAFTEPASLPTNNIRAIQALIYAEVFSRGLSQNGISADGKPFRIRSLNGSSLSPMPKTSLKNTVVLWILLLIRYRMAKTNSRNNLRS